jgi:hypothetical protein
MTLMPYLPTANQDKVDLTEEKWPPEIAAG